LEETGARKVTTSAVISFAEKLEDDSSTFYRKLAEEYAKDKEAFLAFARECEKSKVLVTRTYQETITDALEACFSFEDLNLDDYLVRMTLAEGAGYQEALKTAIGLEEEASRFYFDVAEQSKSFLATIPMAFRKIAERRRSRKSRLESILESLT